MKDVQSKGAQAELEKQTEKTGIKKDGDKQTGGVGIS